MKTADNVASWTPERIETLKQFWAEGLSASQISERMGGTTRSGVIGKVHRLRNGGHDLSVRATPSEPALGRANRVKPPPPPAPPPKIKLIANRQVFVEAERPPPKVEIGDRAFVPLEGCEPVPFGSRGCKWPVSLVAGASMLQCGCERDGESSYCAPHRAAGTQKPRAGAPKNGNELIRSLRRWAA